MDACKTMVLAFGAQHIFRGELLVLGSLTLVGGFNPFEKYE